MKFILSFVILISANTVLALDYFEINLVTRFKSIEYFSLYSLCDGALCKGAELIVPTGASVVVEVEGQAKCTIQESAALVFKGGDSYIVDVTAALNTDESCLVRVTDGGTEVHVRLLNESTDPNKAYRYFW